MKSVVESLKFEMANWVVMIRCLHDNRMSDASLKLAQFADGLRQNLCSRSGKQSSLISCEHCDQARLNVRLRS
jgi:hypothetical protein